MRGRNYDVLLLRPQEIKDVIDIKQAIDLVEQGYREAHGFPIINAPRRRVHSNQNVRISNFPGGVDGLGVIGSLTRGEQVMHDPSSQEYPYREHPVYLLCQRGEADSPGVPGGGAFRKIDVLNNLSLLLIELGFAGRSGDPRYPQLLTLWLDITEAVKFAQPILDVARFVLILAKRAATKVGLRKVPYAQRVERGVVRNETPIVDRDKAANVTATDKILHMNASSVIKLHGRCEVTLSISMSPSRSSGRTLRPSVVRSMTKASARALIVVGPVWSC
jgi:hypothetical protein